MATELIVSLLKKQPLFEGLSDAELRELASIAKSERFPEKARIVEQGELKPVYYLILSGEAIARSVDELGRERPVHYFKEGDAFGETSLLVGEPRDVTVIARTDVEVLYIEKSDFDRLLSRRPEIRRKLRPRPEVRRLWEAPRYDWMVEGEVTIWHGHRHWCVLIPWFFKSLLLFFFLALIGFIAYRFNWLICLGLVSGFIVVIWFLWSSLEWWNWKFDRYIVTNRRVALIETLPYRVAARQEAPIERVQDVFTQKSFPKSVLNVGDVFISTAARTHPIIFQNISRPDEVERIILEQKARALRWERAEERGKIRRKMLGEEILESTASPQLQHSPQLPPFIYPFLGEKREPDQVTWYTHWWVLMRRICLPFLFLLLILIAIALMIWLVFRIKLGACAGVLLFILFVAFVADLLRLITVGWDWANEQYIVTTEQIIMLRITPWFPIIPPIGPISRIDRRVAPLSSVQDVTTSMSGWGRFINMGTVRITTAAPEGVLEFKNVWRPLKVQSTIFEFLERYRIRERQERFKETERLLEDWFLAHREVDHS